MRRNRTVGPKQTKRSQRIIRPAAAQGADGSGGYSPGASRRRGGLRVSVRTQEAFLQLFRKVGTFRGESAFSTWLHRMTVNVVLMRLRKKSLPVASLEETTEPDEDTGGPRKDPGAPDLRLSGAVDRVNLERSVEKLPPGYRTVFVLHDVQGYEHNEIAGIMGCSVGNSKSQLHKARTRLRDLLQESVREQARQERHAAKTQTGNSD